MYIEDLILVETIFQRMVPLYFSVIGNKYEYIITNKLSLVELSSLYSL